MVRIDNMVFTLVKRGGGRQKKHRKILLKIISFSIIRFII